MVVPVLVGRFGNQLFQIACAIAYATKHGLEYHIPAHTANDTVWEPVITHLENPNYDEKLPAIRIEEKTHAYHEIEFKEEWRNYNIFLSGYWQSYKYFDWCIDDVRRIVGNLNFNLNVCSVHVRRGDYLKYPYKHPVVTEKYLHEAISYMADKGDRMFLFFSDDIEWCKDFMKSAHLSVFYSFSETNDVKTDFLYMMNCENNIVANSSFSVLAAILNPNPSKIVVCPHEDNYFGINNKHLDVSTLYPENWHRIKY